MLKNKNISVLDKLVKTEEITNEKSLSTKSATLLLEGPKEHLDILHKVGLTHHIELNKQKLHEKNSVKMLSQIYGGKTYKGSDLKSICNLYDLKLVIARDHKGLLGVEIAEKIQEFSDKNATEVPSKEDANIMVKKSKIDLSYANWFVLAPSEEFIKTSTKSNACTLFYRESYDGADYRARESDKFIEVFSWGKNYSSLRKYNHMYNNYNYNSLNGDETSVRSVVLIFSIVLFLTTLLGVFTTLFTSTIVFSIAWLLIIFFNSINTDINHYKTWNVQNF